MQRLKLAEYAESQLVYRTFHTWLGKYHAQKRLNEMQAELDQIETKFLVRRVYKYWKSGRGDFDKQYAYVLVIGEN